MNIKSRISKGSPLYGSSSHLILSISKFYGHEIGIKDLKLINNIKFDYLSNIKRELFRLELAGLIILNEDKSRWSITNKGVVYLYDLAKRHRILNPTEKI